MFGKRKRVVITIEKKLEAVERIENGEKIKNIAKELNVGDSTVSDWVKSKEKLLQHLGKSFCSKYPPKVIRKSPYEHLNEALYYWFVQQREMDIPITGPMLKEKASFFAKYLGEPYKEFTASEGWLNNWKKRYGVRQMVAGEEKSSLDGIFTVHNHQDNSEVQLGESYSNEQIFNVDETCLNLKRLPAKSILPNYSESLESVKILLCSNASGKFRLPLLIIGKSENSGPLRNINRNLLPVFYRDQSDIQMTPELFSLWFHDEFVPKVNCYLGSEGLPRKALLMLGNSTSHPEVETLRDGDITSRYWPEHHFQNRGVIESFKRSYRKMMLECIISNDSDTLMKNLDSINIKDVVYWSACAWASLSNSTLEKCWNEIYCEFPETDGPDVDLLDMVRRINGCEDITEAEVKQWITGDNDVSCEVELGVVCKKEDPEDISTKPITPEEGFQALEVALKFVEEHPSSTLDDVLFFRQWRDKAARERVESSG